MMGFGLVGIAGAVLLGAASTQSVISVSPSEGARGTQVTIEQTDFASDGPCVIASATLGGQSVDVASGEPGTASFEVPASVGTGDQTVTATCDDGTPAGTATFRVLAAATTTTAIHGTTTTEVGPPPASVSDRPTDEDGDGVQQGEDGGPIAPPQTAPPSDEQPDVPQTLDECDEQAAMAESRLVYEPERRMTVGETNDVQVALSLDDDVAPPVTFGSPTTVVVVPHVRCTVEAVLSGPDFAISPDRPVAQSFVDTRVLVWEWEVTPLRPGEDHELNVRLQAHIREGGRTEPGRQILKETVIDVDAAPQSWGSTLSGWLRDLFGHPAVTVAVVPAAGAVYVALRRRLGHRRPSTAMSGRTQAQQ